MQGVKRYVVQYDMTSIIMIPKGVSSLFTPPSLTSTMVWLDAIEDYHKLEDSNYSARQEFILRHGLDVKIESDSWLEGTLLLSMESTLCAKVESDLKCLPVNQHGAITMLCFIIKCMVIRNQETWDALEEYIETFDIRSFPGENVPTACLKLKAVVTVLGDRLPSNAVRTIFEGFARASTKSFAPVCDSKIAMQSNSIYASLVAKQTLCSQVTSMLNDLEQKYQQLITAKNGRVLVTLVRLLLRTLLSTLPLNTKEWNKAIQLMSKASLVFQLKNRPKMQIYHHCGKKGHVRPLCTQYLAEKANGTLPPPGAKQFGKPAVNGKPAFNKEKCRDKFDKDPKLKALLSAFAAFTSDYIADSQEVSKRRTTTTLKKEMNPMTRTSKLFWAWWVL